VGRSSTPTGRRRTSTAAVLVLVGVLGLGACGDKAVSAPGSGLAAVTTTSSVAAAPTTTAGAAPATTVTTTAAAPPTTKPAGPTITEVAELEKALDDIDKTLSDIQAEINTN
jgi:hypothetical protein